MIHGLDTGFLVAAEVTEHVAHTGTLAHGTRLPGCWRLATSLLLPHRFWQSSSISLLTLVASYSRLT